MQKSQKMSIKDFSGLKIGGEASLVFLVETEKELTEAIQEAKKLNLKIYPIGSGTNTIFKDGELKICLIKPEIKGIIKFTEDEDEVLITSSAGEEWDNLVDWTCKNNLSGIESLSGIPGTVGASPVQNIGAYGQEVSNSIVNVKAYDLEEDKFITLSNAECLFSYRESIFKQKIGKYIITQVSFRLKKNQPKIPIYKDLIEYFIENKNNHPSVSEIRKAVLEIRSKKLLDYKEVPNCGSFFKNPFIDITLLNKILEKYPKLPYFQINENTFKLYAGWLIENIDWQKIETKNIKFHEKNKLVLTNIGNATFTELKKVIELTQKTVESHFGVALEVEPRIFE